ncbi:MAG: hypothetical protein QOH28_2544, partial [Actinomycetota bacterium]|nr:hypothetical protein [Actinomycetota bacterium]
ARQHRRLVRFAWLGSLVLALLTVAASVGALVALAARHDANAKAAKLSVAYDDLRRAVGARDAVLGQLESAKGALSTTKSALDANNKELAVRQTALRNLDRSLRTVQQDLGQTQARLADVNAANSALDVQLAKTRGDLGVASGQLTATRTSLGAVQDELASTRNDLAGTQDALGSTRNELSTTQDALGSTQDRLTNTQDALGSTQDALGSTQDELGRTQDALTATAADASSQRLALDALSQQDGQLDLALLLAPQSWQAAPTSQARDALFQVGNTAQGLTRYLRPRSLAPAAATQAAGADDATFKGVAALSRHGRYAAELVEHGDREIVLWDLAAAPPTDRMIDPGILDPTAIAFSFDESRLLVWGSDGQRLALRSIPVAGGVSTPRGCGACTWTVSTVSNQVVQGDGTQNILLDAATLTPEGSRLAGRLGAGFGECRRIDDAHMLVLAPYFGDTTTCFSPHGRYLVAHTDNGTLRLFDLAQGGAAVPLPLGADAARFAFSADDNNIAVAIGDQVDVIALPAGTVRFQQPVAAARGLALGPEPVEPESGATDLAARLVVVDDSCHGHLFAVATGATTADFDASSLRDCTAISAEFSARGHRIAVTGGGQVLFVDAATAASNPPLESYEFWFGGDQQESKAVIRIGGLLEVFDISNNALVAVLPTSASGPPTVAPDGKTIIVTQTAPLPTLVLHLDNLDVEGAGRLTSLPGSAGIAGVLYVDGDHTVVGWEDVGGSTTAREWDTFQLGGSPVVTTAPRAGILNGHFGTLTAMSPDGYTKATLTRRDIFENTVQFTDLRSGKRSAGPVIKPEDGRPSGLCFSGTGRYLVIDTTGLPDGRCGPNRSSFPPSPVSQVYDTRTRVVRPMPGEVVDFTPDDEFAAVVNGGSVLVIAPSTGQVLGTIDTKATAPLHVVVRDGGRKLIVLDATGRIAIWDTLSARVTTGPRAVATDPNLALAATDDAELIAIGQGGDVELLGADLNPVSGQLPARLGALGGSPITFSRDGALLATGTQIWDVRGGSGGYRKVGPDLPEAAEALVFTADGSALLTTGDTEALPAPVRRLLIEPQLQIEAACSLAGRTLTENEWGQFQPDLLADATRACR